ncbi:tail fiber domain-containing protein [Ichthyenterobacterium sp. W332]|uniref:Tail fiber domain-containing protein n=1 Tax=Microcosmobacter mediterraneus TaxID=3075607 RepID=A0ABU2YGB8_9FLAO|nr:tail fiber domain-containing protein [Ichthyenterobacterium sp. W332]MDT0557082.1 tail fiber domain-containing protein [Ichthyenterobacterium sp. W332]
MRTIYITLFVFFSVFGFGQGGINYKAIVKDSNGNVLSNDLVTIQFTLIQTTENGTIVYQETHTPATDDNGLIIVNIGEGTPSAGNFDIIDWGATSYFLNVQINTGSGLIDLGTTAFKEVPYAKHALVASEARNLSGLEAIDEGNSDGWRLIGANPNNYGNIGGLAVDLSRNDFASTTAGATGSIAISTGFRTTASGDFSLASNFSTNANAYASTSFGRYNVGGGNSVQWEETDKLFEIGNGTNDANRNNAFTILKNGKVGINDATPVYLIDIENDDLASRSIFIDHNSTSSGSAQYGLYIDLDKNNFSSVPAYGSYSSVLNTGGTSYGSYSRADSDAIDDSDAYGVRAIADNDNGTGNTYAIYASLLASNASGDKYAGYFAGDVFTTGSYLPSDENLKTNIHLTQDSALSKLMDLPIENYIYKNDTYCDINLPKGFRTGFTAQNVERIMPELVKTATQPAPTKEEIEAGAQPMDDIQFKAVDYTGMVPYLVKAIQELKRENDLLKARVEALENN